MARLIIAALLSYAVLASPAWSQTGNPAGASPDTPKIETANPPPDHPNTVDQLFVRQASMGNFAEVELSRMAAKQAQSQAVKDFAKQMIDDHTKANDRLAGLAKAKDLPLRKELDGEHKAKQVELSKAKPGEFDALYIGGQVRSHQRTALLLQHHIGSGQDAKLKSYSMQTLPTVLNHLEMAKNIQSQIQNTTPRR